MALDVKLFVTWQDKAFKDSFFPMNLIIQSNFGLRKVIENRRMSHGGKGVRKVTK
jgi:hypothetical protein